MSDDNGNVTSIVVEVAGKYGPKANGKFYGLQKPLKPTDFTAGGKYDVITEPWTSNGKSGLNITRIVNTDVTNVQKEAVSTTPKTDWAAKDRSQLIGGLSHDSPLIVRLSLEFDKPIQVILTLYQEALVGLLDIRKGVK